MKKMKLISIAVLLSLTACAGSPDRVSVELVRVIDGDTIVVKINSYKRTIRLLELDTPERGDPGFKEATEEMKALIKNKKITCLGICEWHKCK